MTFVKVFRSLQEGTWLYCVLTSCSCPGASDGIGKAYTHTTRVLCQTHDAGLFAAGHQNYAKSESGISQ